MQRRYLERGRFASKACVDFAIHNSFKVKCSKNRYQDVSSCVLRTLKGFCMAKSAVDLDVNIVLSKYGFNDVAPFEIVMFGMQKQDLLRVFAFPRTLHTELNSLEKSSTFKG